MAVGAALGATLDGSGAVATSFFGDGATEEGVFHESMNLAATMKLPVLFVCENNLFSSHLHISLRQPADSVARYAAAHRIPSITVDGNDVCSVATAARSAVELCRDGRGPAFVELVTYRWRGHVGPREDNDVGVKRGEELGFWKQRDPLLRLRRALVAARGIPEEVLEETDAETVRRVHLAYELAEAAPYPEAEAVDSFLYCERISRATV
jgi:pyruvate dehydrogenase E1 component alpha subunit